MLQIDLHLRDTVGQILVSFWLCAGVLEHSTFTFSSGRTWNQLPLYDIYVAPKKPIRRQHY